MDFTYKQPLEKILRDMKDTQYSTKLKSASKSLNDWFSTVYLEELIDNEKMMSRFVRLNPEISYGMQIREGLKAAYNDLKDYEESGDRDSLQKGLSIMLPLLRVFIQCPMYTGTDSEDTGKRGLSNE